MVEQPKRNLERLFAENHLPRHGCRDELRVFDQVILIVVKLFEKLCRLIQRHEHVGFVLSHPKL